MSPTHRDGSARSIVSVDLGAVVREAVHHGLLIKGGGHAMAAGFQLELQKQEYLQDSLYRLCRLRSQWRPHSTPFHRRGAVGARCNHRADGPAGSRWSLRTRPSRAALRLSGASPIARAEHQGGACPLHARIERRRSHRGLRLPRGRHRARPDAAESRGTGDACHRPSAPCELAGPRERRPQIEDAAALRCVASLGLACRASPSI